MYNGACSYEMPSGEIMLIYSACILEVVEGGGRRGSRVIRYILSLSLSQEWETRQFRISVHNRRTFYFKKHDCYLLKFQFFSIIILKKFRVLSGCN